MALLIISCAPQPYGTTSTSSSTYVNFDEYAPAYIEGYSKYHPDEQNNPDLDFYDFIKGVKHVVIDFNEEAQQRVDNGEKFALKLGNLYRNYLHNLGFKYVAITTAEKEKLHGRYESLCDVAYFRFYFNINNQK